MKKIYLLLSLSSCLFFIFNTQAQKILYVTETGSGDLSGESWTNASNDLQLAINADGVDQVWVAGGTYKPTHSPRDGANFADEGRDNTFLLQKDVKVYGGFTGSEKSLSQRSLTGTANTSLLSGDIGAVGNNNDNVFSVVTSSGDVGSAELNGFTISKGNGDGTSYPISITVNSELIYNTNGGGISIHSSSILLSNLIISGNNANYGGGIYCINSTPVFTNVSITGNTSFVGGGIYNDNNSSPILTNVTISGNTAAGDAGAIMNFSNSAPQMQIRNTIIYGNSSGIINNAASPPIVTYSLVQGSTDITNGNIDGGTDPKFVSPVAAGLNAGGNYRLQPTSLAVNAGNNAYFDVGQSPDLSAITTDLDDNLRIVGTVDMGAYELQAIIKPDAGGIVYVSPTGNGDQSGESWANAASDLQLSINASGVQQVWVAAGTYKPRYRADNMSGANANDRDNAFVLKKDVKIYGGFAGNEGSLTQRDSTRQTNNTILSGDLGVTGDNSDNAYHVVISAGDLGAAELNSFTIEGGNANGSASENIMVNSMPIGRTSGGGIYNVLSTFFLINVNVSENTAIYGGGIYILESTSSLVLTNVKVSRNTAINYGGGMLIDAASSPVLSNISIIGNEAGIQGGGMYNNEESSPVLTNVTISGNTAISSGGGVRNNNSSLKFYNNIIWGNTAPTGANVSNSSSNPQFYHSLVQGSGGSTSWVSGFGTDGGSNIDADPLFTDAGNGDYSLQINSPAIGTGNNIYYTNAGGNSQNDLDLAGNPRVNNGIIDIGAYEYQGSVLPITIQNFTAVKDGNRAKLEWTTASETNNKEFVIYHSSDGSTFAEIGKVAGSGNTFLEKDYTFYDDDPANGINYYRLQQVDYDGRITDAGIRTVGFSFENIRVKVYPNPTENKVKIEFEPGLYHYLQLTDYTGRELQKVTLRMNDREKNIAVKQLSDRGLSDKINR